MALYVSVCATATIVSVLALSAMAVVRLERKQAVSVDARLAARTNARSAVELALRALNNNASWRSSYSHNVETTPVSLGAQGTGTLSWKLYDSDGSLSDADRQLWLKGIGRVGGTVQVSSLRLQTSVIGPTQLRSYSSVYYLNSADVRNNMWWGQYFKVSLPSEANGWRITSVEFYCYKLSEGQSVRVCLYKTAANSGNLVDSTILSSSGFPATFTWYTINFAGGYLFDRNDGVVVSVEGDAATNSIRLRYRDSNVSEANSALLQGNPTWNSFETNKALLYRINGEYTTSSGVAPLVGTWIWDTL